jgi:predicted nucleic acid-binding protein
VVQAAKFGAMVVVDDRWGRKLAESSDLDFHGTFWVLQHFFQLGLCSSAVTRDHFAELLRPGARMPWEAVNEFLLEIGESPLAELSELS